MVKIAVEYPKLFIYTTNQPTDFENTLWSMSLFICLNHIHEQLQKTLMNYFRKGLSEQTKIEFLIQTLISHTMLVALNGPKGLDMDHFADIVEDFAPLRSAASINFKYQVIKPGLQSRITKGGKIIVYDQVPLSIEIAGTARTLLNILEDLAMLVIGVGKTKADFGSENWTIIMTDPRAGKMMRAFLNQISLITANYLLGYGDWDKPESTPLISGAVKIGTVVTGFRNAGSVFKLKMMEKFAQHFATLYRISTQPDWIEDTEYDFLWEDLAELINEFRIELSTL